MLHGKFDLQIGSEYHESLISFIRQEDKLGYISLKKLKQLTFIRWALLVLIFICIFIFSTSCYLFIKEGKLISLLVTIVFGFLVFLTLSIVSILPFDLQNKFECINSRFDDNSLSRLYIHGAPDDVIDNIICALSRTDDLSYTDIYDIFWLCSRTSAGIDRKILLGERYHQAKKRIALKIFK